MVMKATDLMIGDWVELRYTHYLTKEEVVKVVKVDQIRKYDKDSEHYQAWSKEIGNLGDVEYLFPIPLTAEILDKNGFKDVDIVVVEARKLVWVSEEGRTEIIIWLDDTMPMVIVKNFDLEEEVSYFLPYPRSVNRLQHTLRLCGIDKQIEL